MNLTELRAAFAATETRLTELHAQIGEGTPTDAQTAEWEAHTEARDSAKTAVDEFLAAEKAETEKRSAEKAETEKRAKRVSDARAKFGGINVAPSTSNDADLRSANPMVAGVSEVRSALMRLMEPRMAEVGADTDKLEKLVSRMTRGALGGQDEYAARSWQQKLLVRSTDEYASGFAKYISGNGLTLTPDEARAIAVGTNTSGGFLVPTYLDPTVIITNNGATDLIRPLSAAGGGVKTMLPGTGNVWKGITSAGVTGSWDAEATEVSDDTPEFQSPSVPIYMGRAWAEATFQALVNISGIESELYGMFADERDRMEALAHALGAGTTEPTGIFTAIAATTTSRIVSTTPAEIGVVDINLLHRSLGQRFRRRGTFVMDPLYADAIQALGTSVGVAYTGTIAESYPSTLKNRPVVVSDDAPNTQTTTALDSEVLFGDFSKYIIVDRPGTMAVEFVPNVMGANGRPTSKRGWLMWWETGADSILDNAFRLLVDKTSA